MMDYSDARRVAAMLAAIGEPTRMLILYRLAEGPHHVGQLAEALGMPMVNMSHHLGVMRQAGLLDDEKDGRRVVYRFHRDVHVTASTGDANVLATLKFGRCKFVLRRSTGAVATRSRLRGPHSLRKSSPKMAAQVAE